MHALQVHSMNETTSDNCKLAKEISTVEKIFVQLKRQVFLQHFMVTQHLTFYTQQHCILSNNVQDHVTCTYVLLMTQTMKSNLVFLSTLYVCLLSYDQSASYIVWLSFQCNLDYEATCASMSHGFM